MVRGAAAAAVMLAIAVGARPAAAGGETDDGARLLTEAVRSGDTDAASWARVIQWVLTEKEETVAAGFAQALKEFAAPGPVATADDARWDPTARAVLGAFQDVLDDAQHHRRRDGDAIARGLVALAGPAVLAALQESDPSALEGFAAVGRAMAPSAPEMVAPLARALRDPDPSIRRGAATLLGAFGPSARSAKRDLQAARKDRDPRVRDAARAALSQIEGH
jgi:hypothetical protein